MIDGGTTKDKNKVITHIKDHESKKQWDKFDFLLIMAFGSCFHTHPPIQWWLTMTCVTFFLHMVDWRFHVVDWVSYHRIVIKEEMDRALFKQHLCHFSQATGTPFTVNPLQSSFGEYAELPLGQQFRDGTPDVDNLEVDNYTKEFLCELQRKSTDPPEINPILTHLDI
eukprot:15053435-Ditylum_brightwellii.AAC.1